METKKENKLGTMRVFPLVITVSAPMMVSMLVQALYNIVDSIYVSMISEQALTALTFVFPVQMLMSAFAVGTSVGTASLVSRRLGARLNDEANTAAGNGITLSFLSSLLFVAMGLFASPFYFSIAARDVSDVSIIGYGIQYMQVVTSCCVAVFMAICFEKLLQATGRSVLSMITQALGAITNIILDPIFIFGKYGVPAMGVYGAAVATVIGQCVSCLMGIVFLAFVSKDLKIKPKTFILKGRTVGDIYKVAAPSILIQAMTSVTSFLMNRLLQTYSDTAVAVMGAYTKIQSFVFMPLFGLNSGVVPIVGYNYGAKNKNRIYLAVRYALILGFCMIAIGTFLFEAFPASLLSFFDPSERMLEIGVVAFRTIGLCFIPACLSIVLTGVFGGLGLGYLSMISSLIRAVVVLIPSAYLLSGLFGLDGIWWCYLCAELVGAFVALIMFRFVDRKYISVLEVTNAGLPA